VSSCSSEPGGGENPSQGKEIKGGKRGRGRAQIVTFLFRIALSRPSRSGIRKGERGGEFSSGEREEKEKKEEEPPDHDHFPPLLSLADGGKKKKKGGEGRGEAGRWRLRPDYQVFLSTNSSLISSEPRAGREKRITKREEGRKGMFPSLFLINFLQREGERV